MGFDSECAVGMEIVFFLELNLEMTIGIIGCENLGIWVWDYF